jgi:hypothetical protein
VFTETVAAFETVVAGVNFGEMVQVVPTGIGLVHVVVPLNAALAGVGAPRKVEARTTGWLPMFETVNTPVQGELLPRTGQPAGVPATPEVPMDSGTVPNGTIGFCRFINKICLFPESATYRFPFASRARPAGAFSPVKLSGKGALVFTAGASQTALPVLSET